MTKLPLDCIAYQYLHDGMVWIKHVNIVRFPYDIHLFMKYAFWFSYLIRLYIPSFIVVQAQRHDDQINTCMEEKHGEITKQKNTKNIPL